jgi:S1-C subfamily serine protease
VTAAEEDCPGGIDDYQPAASGVRITSLRDGPAQREGMVVGDIILSVNGVETPSVVALGATLRGTRGPAEIVFRNVENDAIESVVLELDDGRMGIDGETVVL